MTYNYVCINGNCEGSRVHEQPMADTLPKRLKCPVCGKMSLRHAVEFTSAVVIPLDFGTTNNKIKFDKSPSRRKHFW